MHAPACIVYHFIREEGLQKTLKKRKYCRRASATIKICRRICFFVKHMVSRPGRNLNTANRLKNICCSAIKLYGPSDSGASASAYGMVSGSCYARISIWPFYVNLMRKDSCIYARAGVYSPNILIREGWIKYLLGGVRVRKWGGDCPVLSWGPEVEEGGKGGGDWLSVRVSLSASRCHHLKAFGSSESVGRVDLKCPLA